MIKKYWKWQFGRWWPTLLIFGVLLVTTFFFTCVSVSVVDVQASANGTQFYWRSHSGLGIELYILLAVSLIATFVMPLMVFTYRTKKQSADIFYQAAYKPGTIKRIRVLLGLLIIVATFTLAYLVGIAILGIRYASTPVTTTYVKYGTTYIETRPNINFAWYILAYFVLLVGVVGQYFINCFLVGLGDYVLDQIFLLLWGNVIICIGLFAPFSYMMSLASIYDSSLLNTQWYLLFTTPSAIPVFAFIDVPIMTGLKGTYVSSDKLTPNIIGTALFVLFTSGLALVNFFQRDPSGEYANLRGARNKAISLVPHGAALSIGLFIAILLGSMFRTYSSFVATLVYVPFFSLVMFALAYYCLLALWRHSFKPSKVDLISYLCVNGTILLGFLLLAICASSGGHSVN